MILCSGEALIDMIATETGDLRPCSGGAVFNTAVALGRLGRETALFTGLSTDLFGKQLRRDLTASKVGTDLAIQSDRPTTLAFVELINGQAQYKFYDENTAGRMITPAEAPRLSDAVSALFFGGISLINGPAADCYAELMAQNHKTRVVMMDPNIRPAFVTEPVPYRARLTRMLAQCDIVKLSDEDLAWLVPGPDVPSTDLTGAVAEILAMGPKIVLLTEGAKGATAYRADRTPVFAPTQPAEVVDTVGAGDTFNAGFLAALDENGLLTKDRIANLGDAALAQALEFGNRAAAINVTRAGANPPWRAELA